MPGISRSRSDMYIVFSIIFFSLFACAERKNRPVDDISIYASYSKGDTSVPNSYYFIARVLNNNVDSYDQISGRFYKGHWGEISLNNYIKQKGKLYKKYIINSKDTYLLYLDTSRSIFYRDSSIYHSWVDGSIGLLMVDVMQLRIPLKREGNTFSFLYKGLEVDHVSYEATYDNEYHLLTQENFSGYSFDYRVRKINDYPVFFTRTSIDSIITAVYQKRRPTRVI